MKRSIPFWSMSTVGLIVAGFLYPLLHEAGHFCAAIFTGADIIEFQLFPVPSVLCRYPHPHTGVLLISGAAGLLFPVLPTMLTTPQNFWAWYTWFVLKGICIFSFFLSLCALVAFQSGFSSLHEDIIQMVQLAPAYMPIYFIFLSFLLVLNFLQIVASKPLQRCTLQFGYGTALQKQRQ